MKSQGECRPLLHSLREVQIRKRISRRAALGTIALAALALPISACSVSTAQTASATSRDLNVVVDRTGSPIDQSLAEAWSTVEAELPVIIEAHEITRLRIWGLDGDGWSLALLKDLSLPSLSAPVSPASDPGDFDEFRNVRDAQDQENRKRQNERTKKYRAALQQALLSLQSLHVLPEPRHEATKTDIVGLLQRISHSSSTASFILITDLADSHYRHFPHVLPPPPDVSVLVLVVPAKPKDVILTLGSNLSANDQFEARCRQIRESAPWVTAAPYFVHNVSDFLKPAITQLVASPQTQTPPGGRF